MILTAVVVNHFDPICMIQFTWRIKCAILRIVDIPHQLIHVRPSPVMQFGVIRTKRE